MIALAAGQSIRPVWENELGGVTYQLGDGLHRQFLKWAPIGGGIDLLAEAVRLRWAAAAGEIDPARWDPDHRNLDLDAALAAVAVIPDIDRLVVCHGDACAPNTLIADDGRWSGHVDLGQLGVADRWADLAVATWSTVWNYGPGWEGALLAAYGVDADPERTRYYRLLWDLGP